MFGNLSLSGIEAAVQAGLDITLRTRKDMPGSMQDVSSILPSAGNHGITLSERRGGEAVNGARQMLAKLMEEALAQVK